MNVPRDKWGRPLVVPPAGGEPVPYTRVSTLSRALKDQSHLTRWTARMAAIGLGTSPSLRTRLAGTLAAGDPDSPGTKQAIDKIVDDALAAAGAGDAAATGTGLHLLTQAADGFAPPGVMRGGSWRDLASPDDARRVSAYLSATSHLRRIDAEVFVVQDDLCVAGTYDRLFELPDGSVLVSDIKTGAWDARYPMAVAAQLAGYARASRYDPGTGERKEIHPSLDRSRGLLIHLLHDKCDVITLDLDLGWYVLSLAAKVREVRSLSPSAYVSG